MEDISINDWRDTEKPTDVRLSVLILKMAQKIMELEKASSLRHDPRKGGIERQDWFHRAVVKLHYLLCSPAGEDFRFTASGLYAAKRFETLIAQAGYPGGLVVFGGQFHGIPVPVDEKYLSPTIEEVVKHLSRKRIFLGRFWSSTWSFERIEAELAERFDTVMKIPADFWMQRASLSCDDIDIGQLSLEE